MPATLEAPTEPNAFGDLIPKTDYGSFADLVPDDPLTKGGKAAGAEDFGLFQDLVPKSPTSETEKAVAATPSLPYETKLSPSDEQAFQVWKSQVASNDSGNDYDFRGAFKAGVLPDPITGHWPDTFKKPNHATFSDQSQYAKDRPDLAGRWEGEKFIPPDSFLAAEKGVSNLSGIPFHQTMNALRSLSAGAGKYIFEGLQGFEQERAKTLANPPSELTQPQGDEIILPDGSVMSQEQQNQLEQRYHDAAVAQIPDAKVQADYFKQIAANADTSQYVDAALANTIPARIAHAAGSAGVMALESLIPYAGIPLMVYHGALATEAEAKNAGKTDAEAEAAGVRSAIGLALFGGASKLAALGVAQLLPEGSSTITKFLSQFLGQEVANETSSRAINAWGAASDAPDGKKIEAALNALKDTTLEQSTLNAVYALAHASNASGKEPVRPASATEPKIQAETPEIAPATPGEPIEQASIAEVLKPETQPRGEPNAVQVVSPAEEIPRATETRQDQSSDSERVGRSEQGNEVTGTPQAQEPTGVADAIAEIQRRNAPAPSLGEHGVSRAARESAGELDVMSAGHNSAEAHVERGNKLISAGVIPDEIVQDAITRNAWSSDAVDAAIAKDADLTEKARSARRAADADPSKEPAAAEAEKAAQTWEDAAIRPIRGQFHETGIALQSARNLDTGDYVDYSKTFVDKNGRAPDAKEETVLQKATRKIRDLNAADARDLNQLDRTGGRPKKTLDPKRLREELAALKEKMLADCLL